jgi:CubicO group peptidase (beta-lactamase class C family)
MKKICVIAALIAVMLPAASGAETFRARDWFDSVAAETAIGAAIKTHRIPGLAVAVVDREGIVYSAGFGESEKGVPVTPDTPFYLGSTSKTITALAVLDLECAGKLSLDDPISKYLPELPPFAATITVRHLLNHTSGLTGKGLGRVARGEPSLGEEVKFLSRCVPQSDGGERYEYFNGNYRLLGAIVERAGGITFGDYVSRVVFEPLGMSHSSAVPGYEGTIARGHGSLFGFPYSRDQAFRPGAVPSGYIVSSASDFALLLADELRSASLEPCVLDRESVAESWVSPEGKPYAMGWIRADESLGGPFLFHGGELESYMSFIMIDPSTGRGFVLMMNQGGILPMLGGFSAVRGILLALVKGEQIGSGPSRTLVLIVSIATLALVALELLLTYRLRSWVARAHKRSRFALAVSFVREALPALAVILFVPVVNRITGEAGDWLFLWSYLPEAVIAAFSIVVFALVRIAYKTYYYFRITRSSL